MANKLYDIHIEFKTIGMNVYAKNKREAKRKAYAKLKKMSAFKYVEKIKSDANER